MSLDAALLAAHEKADHAELVRLYQQAAAEAETAQMAGFYLTHAHVFALEIGHPDSAALRQQLVDQGREAPLPPPKPPLR